MDNPAMHPGAQRVHVVDSHTGGEPTRVVVAGGPDLGGGTMAERRTIFRERFDAFRSAVVCEPRGSDVVVGGLLCDPVEPSSAAGVIFFNNVGCIGMCGHGMIGVVATLAYLKRIQPGDHVVETPVGKVTATLHADGRVTIQNVPSYRHAKNVAVAVPGHGLVRGDIAWGGNWFFLISEHSHQLSLANIERLTEFTWAVRQALAEQGIQGAGGEEIDHVELFGPPQAPGADSKNFVLCPGKAYDRSACGTGTSAKLACLVADGKLRPGQAWRQESIVGSMLEATAVVAGDRVIPHITGQAFVTAEATLLLDANDPFRFGIRV